MHPLNFCFLLLTICLAQISYGQTQTVLDEVSDLTCTCLTEKAAKNELSNPELDAGLCILQATQGKSAQIQEELAIDISTNDQQAFFELGKAIGVNLALSCPAFMKAIEQAMAKDSGFKERTLQNLQKDLVAPEQTNADSFIGEVTNIENNDLAIIHLKTSKGRKIKFYWMDYFEGEELFRTITNFPTSTNYVVTFKEKEVYSPKLKDYYNIKVITKVKPF